MYIDVKKFIKKNIKLDFYSLSEKFEKEKSLNYNKWKEEGVFFTNEKTIRSILKNLNIINKKNWETIKILEPSVWSGNFLPIIFEKFSQQKNMVDLYINDIDPISIDFIKECINNKKIIIPNNFKLFFNVWDFFYTEYKNHFDYIIWNPPYWKIIDKNIKNIFENKKTNNMFSFFIEKAVKISDNIAFIVPKWLLYVKQFDYNRKQLRGGIYNIIDYWKTAFNVNLETISFLWSKTNIQDKILIESKIDNNYEIKQKRDYIFDKTLPIWLIYRNIEFDSVLNKIKLGQFNVFRDRQITNKMLNDNWKYRVLKGKNIWKNKIININNYDSFIDNINNLQVSKFLNKNNILCLPNLTNNIRFSFLPKDTIVNWAVALIYKPWFEEIQKETIDFLNSDEYKSFFNIVKNKSKLSVNIDEQVWFFIWELK